MNSLDATLAERCARLAMAGLVREYPNQIALMLRSDADVRSPRELTPAFYGCYDWHSAVHSHWCLVRLLKRFPQAEWAGDAMEVLSAHLTESNLKSEAAYVGAEHRRGFERPYGLAWLLQLVAELHEWENPAGRKWRTDLTDLERIAVSRFSEWLPQLSFPIRSGEHSQTAFAMGLAWDYAMSTGDDRFQELLRSRAIDFHGTDREAPLDYEPSGHDFLSPCLAEADLMRRVLDADAFAAWVDAFLPRLSRDGSAGWLPPVVATDRSDGKIAHLDGLNLSRAWMLEGIAGALPTGDARRPALSASADQHREKAFTAVSNEDYALTHWIGTFAVYLLSGRGRPGS